MNKIVVQKTEIKTYREILWKKKIIIIPIVIIGIILLILASFGIYLRGFMYSQNKVQKTTAFTIDKGEDVRLVVKNLSDANIINNDWPFLLYLKFKGLSSQLIAGEYQIGPKTTPMEVADILTNGRVASLKITIPEGWSNQQIADYLDKKNIVTKEDFLAATKKNYDYEFLKDKPSGTSLEGYLFPDTYQISYNAKSEDIINQMLKNFDKRVTPQIRSEIKASDESLFDVLTLASVVEREVSKPEDRKVVAGIFLLRLKEGMALESCATIQYILGVNKMQFTYEETRTESPYNTYLNKGLPVGPISNPGIDSINAVLYPQITDYLFFLSADGITYYSKTLDEHEAKKNQYLQ